MICLIGDPKAAALKPRSERRVSPVFIMPQRKDINSPVLMLTAFLCALTAAVVILSCVPPVSRDALVHHLAVPKLYLRHGGMYEIPAMPFSYFPMNLDLLYLIPLYFGNDILPKFIHFAFALLTAWLIFDYLRRRINVTFGLFGAVFFLSIPVVVRLSITVYVDLGLVFFSTAALLLLLKWMEQGFRLRFLILSAVSCGLALGTKYNGLVTCFLLTLFVPFLYSRYSGERSSRFGKAVGWGVLFCLVSLFVFSPWMARDYRWKGNPVYPLYDGWFHARDSADKEGGRGHHEKSSIGIFTYRRLMYHETGWQMVLLPVRIFFQGRDGDPRYFDGRLNPFLFLLPLFAFYRSRGDPSGARNEKKILLAFSALFVTFALFSTVLRVRYLAPVIPPLVILSAFGARNIGEILKKRASFLPARAGEMFLALILAAPLLLNAIYVAEQFRRVKPFDYLSGVLSRDDYIRRYVPEYPVLNYVNAKLPPDAKLLFIFIGKRGYYCDRDYVPGTGWLYETVKRATSPDAVLARLGSLEITHLLIRHDLFDKWERHLADRDRIISAFIKRYCKLLYSERGYGLWLVRYPAS